MSIGKRAFIAFLLSVVVPGLGQIYNGQIIAGTLLAVVAAAFISLAGLLGLLLKFSTALAYVICLWAFELAVAVHAAMIARRQVKENALPRDVRRLYALAVVIVGAIAFAGFAFPDRIPGVRGYKVNAESMSPTLVVGDRFAVDVKYYETHPPRRGDVIVFRMPTGGVVVTKRIIAVEGDTIAGGPDGTIVNGSSISEPYLFHDGSQGSIDNSPKFGPVSIPPNRFFVMGDNRAESYDSRHFGSVDVSHLMGKALYVYYSADSTGRIGHIVQ